MVGGKSFKLKVRAATTQLSPTIDYTIFVRLKLFAGSSLYVIRSRYLKGNPTNSLGEYFGYSAIFGVKINLGKIEKIII